MLSKFSYLIVCILLFKSSPVFSVTSQSFSPKNCKRAFISVFQNPQIIQSTKIVVNAVAGPVKPLLTRQKKSQNPVTNVDPKEESERMARLQEHLRVWSSPQVKTRIIKTDHFEHRFEAMTQEGVFKEISHPEASYRELFVGSKQIERRISEAELTIPEKTNEEKKLKAQGFSEIFTRGVDEVNETIAIREQLRKMTVHPYTVHFNYFGEKMREHIDFMEKGAVHPGQIRRLTLLREPMEAAIREKTVTYEKWIWFNVMLAEIISDSPLLGGQLVKRLISYFPSVILMPTISGVVGLIAINKGIEADAYVLGLSNKQSTNYDAIRGNPLDIFSHDLDHTKRIVESKRSHFYENVHKKISLVRKQVDDLPTKERKSVELSYWLIMHEHPDRFWGFPGIIKQEVITEIPYLMYHYPSIFYSRGGTVRDRLVRLLFKKGYSKYFAQRISERVSDDFMKLYDSIQLEIYDTPQKHQALY